MTFTQKLDSLMSLSATSNTVLAKALHIDRSGVSRLRSGSRQIPKQAVIRQMADYFAACCTDDYQISALCELTGTSRLRFPKNRERILNIAALSDTIFTWLSSADDPSGSGTSRFLHSIDQFSPTSEEVEIASPEQNTPLEKDLAIYSAGAGRRQAVLDLLSGALALGNPCKILLFSDQNPEWLIEDSDFLQELAHRVTLLTERGYTAVYISHPNISLESSLRALELWLPAFMAGAVEQYYYPYARDTLHRRSLFVVPEHFSLLSDSVGVRPDASLTYLTTKRVIVDDAATFSHLLAQCRPMVQVYTLRDLNRFLDRLEALTASPAQGIYKSNWLSVLTLPKELISRMGAVQSPLARQLFIAQETRVHLREEMMRNYPVYDIMSLPPIEKVLSGMLEIPGSRLFTGTPFYYTPREYMLHLRRILWHLDNFPHYQAIITDDPQFNDMMLFVKGDNHAMLIRSSEPFAAFDITEQSMAAALHVYLQRFADAETKPGSRRETHARLEAELARMRAAIH